jgi:gamma-glutamylcyclotransferase (GGCT)/AIG2-like uncharacterized protein YtfP
VRRTPASGPAADHLFVYGSLRTAIAEEARAAGDVLSAHARRLGEASMQGRLYAVSWYPGFAPGHSRIERVIGDVWRIRNRAALFAALDTYEGREYVRARRVARMASGVKISAWVYIYAAELNGAPKIPSGDFAEWLRANGSLR